LGLLLPFSRLRFSSLVFDVSLSPGRRRPAHPVPVRVAGWGSLRRSDGGDIHL